MIILLIGSDRARVPDRIRTCTEILLRDLPLPLGYGDSLRRGGASNYASENSIPTVALMTGIQTMARITYTVVSTLRGPTQEREPRHRNGMIGDRELPVRLDHGAVGQVKEDAGVAVAV